MAFLPSSRLISGKQWQRICTLNFSRKHHCGNVLLCWQCFLFNSTWPYAELPLFTFKVHSTVRHFYPSNLAMSWRWYPPVHDGMALWTRMDGFMQRPYHRLRVVKICLNEASFLLVLWRLPSTLNPFPFCHHVATSRTTWRVIDALMVMVGRKMPTWHWVKQPNSNWCILQPSWC